MRKNLSKVADCQIEQLGSMGGRQQRANAQSVSLRDGSWWVMTMEDDRQELGELVKDV